jgi:hypothetical protein
MLYGTDAPGSNINCSKKAVLMLMELQGKGTRGEEAQALGKGKLERQCNAKSGDSGDNEPERVGQSSMTMPRVAIVVTPTSRADFCKDPWNGEVCPLYKLSTSEFAVQDDLSSKHRTTMSSYCWHCW